MHRLYYVIENIINLLLPHLWFLLWSISIILIIKIVFTTEKFGSFERSKDYNDLWLALSVGMFTSCFFYFVNDVIPKRELRKTMKNIIAHELEEIWELLRECTMMIISREYRLTNLFEIYADKPKRIPKRTEYLRLFNDYNFRKDTYSSQPALKYFEEKRLKIKNKGLFLLNNYSRCLSIAQIRYLKRILTSPFGTEELLPIDFEIEEKYKDSLPSNQNKMGCCLYDLYKRKIPK